MEHVISAGEGVVLSPSLEHYLKEVFRLQGKQGFARVRDLALRLHVAKSAVTVALRHLADKGLVVYRPYEPVTLTGLGRGRAEELELRYRVLTSFLQDVLVLDAERVEAVACAMEHALEPQARDRLVCFMAFVGRRRQAGEGWLDDFRAFLAHGDAGGKCRACIDDYLRELTAATNDSGVMQTGAGREI